MANYEAYPNKKTVPSRMQRKHSRNKIFMNNAKAIKLQRLHKAERIAALNAQRHPSIEGE